MAGKTVKLDWSRKRSHMGERSYCCRLIRLVRERLPDETKGRRSVRNA
jgi:hypothetical protein